MFSFSQGFEPMIEASESGLPVDLTQVSEHLALNVPECAYLCVCVTFGMLVNLSLKWEIFCRRNILNLHGISMLKHKRLLPGPESLKVHMCAFALCCKVKFHYTKLQEF